MAGRELLREVVVPVIVKGCDCAVCECSRRLERDGTEYVAPPWTCGDCGNRDNYGTACDWCGRLWEFT